MGMLAGFMAHPHNIKGFFRYRWMLNYLAVPMMIDKHTAGLRGNHLRIAHEEYDLVDPRVVPRQNIRDDVNRYMRSILREEPLDPSLEILDDAQSW